MEGRGCIDKHRIPVRVQEHGCAYQAPGIFIYKLPFVKDQNVGIVAAQAIGIPSGLGLESLFGPLNFNEMLNFVFSENAVLNWFVECPGNCGPEAPYLLLCGGGVEDTTLCEKPFNCCD